MANDSIQSRLLQQILTERDALRAQNDQLWTIIKRQESELKGLRNFAASATHHKSAPVPDTPLSTPVSTPQSLLRQQPAAQRQVLLAKVPAVPRQKLLQAVPEPRGADVDAAGAETDSEQAPTDGTTTGVDTDSQVAHDVDSVEDRYNSVVVHHQSSSRSDLLRHVLVSSQPPSEPAPAVPVSPVATADKRRADDSDRPAITEAQRQQEQQELASQFASSRFSLQAPDMEFQQLQVADADERAHKRVSRIQPIEHGAQVAPASTTQTASAHFSFVPVIPDDVLPLRTVAIPEAARKSMSFRAPAPPRTTSRPANTASVIVHDDADTDGAVVDEEEEEEELTGTDGVPHDADRTGTSAGEDRSAAQRKAAAARELLLRTAEPKLLARPSQEQLLLTMPRKTIGKIPLDIPGRIRILQQHLAEVNLYLEVISSAVRLNQNGKEFTVYNISLFTQRQVAGQPGNNVPISMPPSSSSSSSSSPSTAIVERVEVWRVEKRYSDFLELHERVQQRLGRSNLARLGVGRQPPNKTLFEAKSGMAPSKVDKRRETLQQYLYSILSVEAGHLQAITDIEQVGGLEHYVADHSGILEFLATDVYEVSDRRRDRMFDDAVMEGYLTKRGRKLQQWKRRFFVLRGQQLDYYERQEDAAAASHIIASKTLQRIDPLGSIQLKGAKVAKQKGPQERPASDPYAEYRHALMITELVPAKGNNKSRPSKKRTILCAESDVERDEWLYYLARQVDYLRLMDERRQRRKQHGDQTNEAYGNPAGAADESRDGVSKSADGSAAPPATSRPAQDPRNVAAVQAPSSAITEQSRDTSTINPTKYFDWGRANAATRSSTLTSALTANGSSTPQPYNDEAGGERRVFGVRLEDAIAYSRVKEGYELPAVVYRCLEYLEVKKAYTEEGIYRLSGSSADMKYLRSRFEKEGDVDLLAEKRCDVHVAAGLLKLYLRELPESILTSRLHRAFLDITDLLEREDRLTELARLVSMLPLAQYTILRTLIAHLIIIVSNNEVNKMNLRNVGIVFSPTLAIPAGIFTLMLTEFEFIFDVRHEELNADYTSALTMGTASQSRQQRIDDQSLDNRDYGSVIVTREPRIQYTADISGGSSAMADSYEVAAAVAAASNVRRQQEHRVSWRADHVEVEGRSHRNSQIYFKNAPATVTKTEHDILHRRNTQLVSDTEDDDDNGDNYMDRDAAMDFSVFQSMNSSSEDLLAHSGNINNRIRQARDSFVMSPRFSTGTAKADPERLSSVGAISFPQFGQSPALPPPLVQSQSRQGSVYASSDAETISDYNDDEDNHDHGQAHNYSGENASTQYSLTPVVTVEATPIAVRQRSAESASPNFKLP